MLGSQFLLLIALRVLALTALEPATPLANYGRQSWAMENGLPQNTVQALLQTRDGFVWLGTEVGLVRFDGNGFQVFDRTSTPALPGNDIHALLETRDGSLWIGTSEGLARWKDGAARAFTTKDGLPGNDVRALAEDPSGAMWVYTEAGLARLNGERFEAARRLASRSGDHPRRRARGRPVSWVDATQRMPATHGARPRRRPVCRRRSSRFLATFNNGAIGVANKSTCDAGQRERATKRG